MKIDRRSGPAGVRGHELDDATGEVGALILLDEVVRIWVGMVRLTLCARDDVAHLRGWPWSNNTTSPSRGPSSM